MRPTRYRTSGSRQRKEVMRMSKARLMYFLGVASLLAFHGAAFVKGACAFLPGGMGDGHL
jgi:hypothetical protein